jgi:hypothetical protein
MEISTGGIHKHLKSAKDSLDKVTANLRGSVESVSPAASVFPAPDKTLYALEDQLKNVTEFMRELQNQVRGLS